jgi:hypothetical protein
MQNSSDMQNRTGKRGQAESGKAEQDRYNRIGLTGQAKQGWKNRTGRTGQAECGTGSTGLTRQDLTAKKGQPGQDSWKRTART